jgi:hypothetical protein
MGKQVNRALLPKAAQGKPKCLEILKAFPLGNLPTLIGEDLKKQVGHPVQGLIIKSAEAKRILDETKKAVDDNKIATLHLTLGVSGKDMILLATDDGWEKFGILVAGYTDIIDQQKAPQKGVVVNLDPKDDTGRVPAAAANIAQKLNTTPVLKAGVGDKLVGIGAGNIVLLAHGEEDKTSSGQIYGKNFAGQSPASIIKLLTANADPKKRLLPTYAGTLYLDGCFTAQGAAMKNYALQVWNGLKAAGIPNVKVMGNLGAATTQQSGDELINPTLETDQYEEQLKAIKKRYEPTLAASNKKIMELMEACKAKGGNPATDPAINAATAKMEAINAQLLAESKQLLDKTPTRVKNLTGKFGVSTVN